MRKTSCKRNAIFFTWTSNKIGTYAGHWLNEHEEKRLWKYHTFNNGQLHWGKQRPAKIPTPPWRSWLARSFCWATFRWPSGVFFCHTFCKSLIMAHCFSRSSNKQSAIRSNANNRSLQPPPPFPCARKKHQQANLHNEWLWYMPKGSAALRGQAPSPIKHIMQNSRPPSVVCPKFRCPKSHKYPTTL